MQVTPPRVGMKAKKCPIVGIVWYHSMRQIAHTRINQSPVFFFFKQVKVVSSCSKVATRPATSSSFLKQ
eukprot:scaffold710_cov171-Amphora_coffeaeformis.AAC.61